MDFLESVTSHSGRQESCGGVDSNAMGINYKTIIF
jgi:hypothetical protein